jgi:hypothetical protein
LYYLRSRQLSATCDAVTSRAAAILRTSVDEQQAQQPPQGPMILLRHDAPCGV